MYRLVSFFVIFSFISVMLYFHNQNSHFSSVTHLNNHHPALILPKSETTPTITASVIQDRSGTWLLKIETSHFKFTPEKIGTEDITYNEGHAHLFINGEKINRIYGNYYNIDNLKPGKNHIKVTLNGNNHGVFTTHDGKEIAYNQIIDVP
ncbi:hypothetical protein [Bacillus sp. Marseille-P3661]|uniref:hypothetical protein n=1 Tax=Bacillus sp. Marseille-P3661 TaxID=1936234 RepID=UPI000C81DD5A|nr:hypothetical protein [Bacillus sp. Marseille-P3661]